MNPNQNIENFEAGIKSTLKELRKSKPWRGTIDERKIKFETTHKKLCEITGVNVRLMWGTITEESDKTPGASGNSGCGINPLNGEHCIRITGRLSVITFIQLWGCVLGMDHISVISWSKDIFAEIFPKSAKGLVVVSGLMIKESEIPEGQNDANNDPMFTDGDNPPSDNPEE